MKLSKTNVFYLFVISVLGILFFVLPITHDQITIFSIQNSPYYFYDYIDFIFGNVANYIYWFKYLIWSIPLLIVLSIILSILKAKELSRFVGFIAILENLFCLWLVYLTKSTVYDLFYVYLGITLLALVSVLIVRKPKKVEKV